MEMIAPGVKRCSECGRVHSVFTACEKTIARQINGDALSVDEGGSEELEEEEILKVLGRVVAPTRSARDILRTVAAQYSENPTLPYADRIAGRLVRAMLDEVTWAIEHERDDGMGTVEANFEMYVDGWTLKGTDLVGEVEAVRASDGARVVFPSRSLTSFLERRLPDICG